MRLRLPALADASAGRLGRHQLVVAMTWWRAGETQTVSREEMGMRGLVLTMMPSRVVRVMAFMRQIGAE